jgi:hypothetical protein
MEGEPTDQQRRMYFEHAEWNMLLHTLLRSCSALRLHTTEPLSQCEIRVDGDSVPRSNQRGRLVARLLCGYTFLRSANVALGTIFGFPTATDKGTCGSAAAAFRSHEGYKSFMERILACHLREHTQTKSSESKRAIKEDDAAHAQRIFDMFDTALQWLAQEDVTTTTTGAAVQASVQRDAPVMIVTSQTVFAADALLQKVFDLTTRDSFVTVSAFRKQFMLELFRAVCNFIMRYYFVSIASNDVGGAGGKLTIAPSVGKKLYVSFLPLLGGFSRHPWCVSRVSSPPPPVRTQPAPSSHATTPITDAAWNTVHSGTSELVPLMLNLFGFEHCGETAAIRQQIEEGLTCDALQLLQADVCAFQLNASLLHADHHVKSNQGGGCLGEKDRDGPIPMSLMFGLSVAETLQWQSGRIVLPAAPSATVSISCRFPTSRVGVITSRSYSSPLSLLYASVEAYLDARSQCEVVASRITSHMAEFTVSLPHTEEDWSVDDVPILSPPSHWLHLSETTRKESLLASGSIFQDAVEEEAECALLVACGANINRLCNEAQRVAQSAPALLSLPRDMCNLFVALMGQIVIRNMEVSALELVLEAAVHVQKHITAHQKAPLSTRDEDVFVSATTNLIVSTTRHHSGVVDRSSEWCCLQQPQFCVRGSMFVASLFENVDETRFMLSDVRIPRHGRCSLDAAGTRTRGSVVSDRILAVSLQWLKMLPHRSAQEITTMELLQCEENKRRSREWAHTSNSLGSAG